MAFIDTHMHLTVKQYRNQEAAVVARAKAAGIEAMICVGTEEESGDSAASVAMAHRFENVYATLGAHPHSASAVTDSLLENFSQLASDPKVVAIGEIGLDYFRMRNSKEEQRSAFVRQLEVAKRFDKPVVIHARDAWDDLFPILEKAGVRGVIHSFTGGPAEAQKALDLGFFIAFNGIVTFPKTTGLQAAAAMVPADRLVLETDAPFLAPQSQRGKTNEPAFMIETAQHLAHLRGVSTEELAAQTTANALRLFEISL